MLSVENVFVTPGGKKNLSLATQTHKKLAEEAGGTNDFATLLYVYRQCHSRLVVIFQSKTVRCVGPSGNHPFSWISYPAKLKFTYLLT